MSPGEKVLIIRCRDCVFWQDAEDGVVEMPICERLTAKYTGLRDEYVFRATENDYCSFAKMKE